MSTSATIIYFLLPLCAPTSAAFTSAAISTSAAILYLCPLFDPTQQNHTILSLNKIKRELLIPFKTIACESNYIILNGIKSTQILFNSAKACHLHKLQNDCLKAIISFCSLCECTTFAFTRQTTKDKKATNLKQQ